MTRIGEVEFNSYGRGLLPEITGEHSGTSVSLWNDVKKKKKY